MHPCIHASVHPCIHASVHRQVAHFCSDVHVAISGTPVENRLGDLHALFELLMKGYLGERRDFAETYERPIKEEADEAPERLRELKALIDPFMMRRTKSDKAIAPDLPSKTSAKLVVALSEV